VWRAASIELAVMMVNTVVGLRICNGGGHFLFVSIHFRFYFPCSVLIILKMVVCGGL
jgi:hypothetical protein